MNTQTHNQEYEDLYQQATHQIAQAANATSARMYDWNAASSQIRVISLYCAPEASAGEHRDDLGATYDLREFPAALRYLINKKAYAIRADSPNADMADRAQLTTLGSKSMLKLPMVAQEVATGFIELCESRYAREWNAGEIQLYQSLANQAALTIENVRLHKNETKQSNLLGLLHNLASYIEQTSDSDSLLQTIVDTLAYTLKYALVEVLTLDQTGQTIVQRAQAGSSALHVPHDYQQSLEDGIVGYVARTSNSYLSNDVRQDPHYIGIQAVPRGSELAVPLLHAGICLGVLNLESEHRDAFSLADVHAMEILAGQLSDHLERAKIYVQTRQRLSELALLSDIAMACATASQTDSLLQQVTEAIAANLYSDNFGFLVLDANTGILRLHHTYYGLPINGPSVAIRLGEGITGQTALTGRPLFITDVRRHPHYLTLSNDIRSEMAAPIYVGERLFGVLNVESRQAAAFGEDDLRLLVRITEQLSPTLERIQAQEHTMQAAARLAVINEIRYKANITPDTDHLLKEVARLLHQRLGYEHVLTARVDRLAGLAIPVEYSGRGSTHLSDQTISLEQGNNILKRTVLEGQIVHVADTQAETDYTALFPEIRCELCVPIGQADQETIGLMAVASRQPGAFALGDIDTLKSLAEQLAGVLAYTHLHQETQHLARELNGLRQVNDICRLMNEPDTFYEQATIRLAQILDVEQCGIALYDPLSHTVSMQSPSYGLSQAQFALYQKIPITGSSSWLQGKSIVTNTPLNDARFNPEVSDYLALELRERNLLIVPMISGGRCLGVIRLANKVGGEHFTSDDAHLLEVFSQPIANVIEMGLALAGQRQWRDCLTSLRQSYSTWAACTQVQTLVEAIGQQLLPMFQADRLTLARLETDPLARSGNLGLSGYTLEQGNCQPFQMELAADSPMASVLHTGQPGLLSNAAQDGGVSQLDPAAPTGDKNRLCSWLGAPIFYRSPASPHATQVIGLISLTSYAPGQFKPEDMEMLDQIAPQVGLMLQNIYARQQYQQHITEQIAMQQASARLEASADPGEIAYAVIEGARALTGASDARIFHYDAEREQLALMAARSHYKHKTGFDHPPQPDGPTMQAAHSGALQVLDFPSQAGEETLFTAISIPIKRHEHSLAVLNLAFADGPYVFNDEQRRWLDVLAHQAALALENARLREAVQQQQHLTEILCETFTFLNTTSTDLHQTAPYLLQQIKRLVGYEQAFASLLVNGRLILQAATGFQNAHSLLPEQDIDHLPLARRIMDTAQPAWLDDVNQLSPPVCTQSLPYDIIEAAGSYPIKAMLGLPITHQNQVGGIIYLCSPTPGAFSPEQAQYVQMMINSMAWTIQE